MPYAIAQKSLALNCDFSSGTTNTKPVVNLRNEPHADAKRFVRVHDTSGDPTMSPWATRVKLGAGSLVLRLIEHGMTIDTLRFRTPLHEVARSVALDSNLQNRYRLNDGGSLSAIETQSEIIKYVKKLANDTTLSDEELWTLDEWEKALWDLQKDPRSTADRIEWVMRREVLAKQREKQGWCWNSEQLRYTDRRFSNISVNGLARALREKTWAKYASGIHG